MTAKDNVDCSKTLFKKLVPERNEWQDEALWQNKNHVMLVMETISILLFVP